MGTVYKVRHLISDRQEAMKLVLPELTENLELADRFMREIKVQARLSHPNIAALHNALRLGDQLVMVMELVEGQTLHSILRQGPMEPIAAINITLQILSALEYAHSQNVVHRDIKPANIMLTTGGTVKLMDFGIARSLLDDNRLTRTGAAIGSIYYMSPEQVDDLPVDARSDLYSVGVLLYEMATGVRPIIGDSSRAVMNGQVSVIPRAPSVVNPRVTEALSLAILIALEKNKEQRFQSARAFADSLLAVRARLSAAQPPWTPVRSFAELRRNSGGNTARSQRPKQVGARACCTGGCCHSASRRNTRFRHIAANHNAVRSRTAGEADARARLVCRTYGEGVGESRGQESADLETAL